MKEFNPNNNIDNISDNFDNNSNNYNINNASYNSNSPQNIRKIYEENEKRNRIKIETTEFMSYAVKVELLFQTLHGYLYWISNCEFLFFLVLFFLFCSSPKTMGKIWWYIFHFFRGIFGIGIICYLPKTYELIENLQEIPDNLENIKYSLIQIFFELLKPNQRKLKIFLLFYFSLTILCTVIDIMLFCVFAPDIGIVENDKPFFFMLFSSIIFIYTDLVYFSFFSSFKFYFNKKQHDSIQRATILGFFDQLKIGMGKGVVKMARKVGKIKGNLGNIKSMKNPFRKKENVNSNNIENNNDNNDNVIREVNVIN
jgi:hypothetical protein